MKYINEKLEELKNKSPDEEVTTVLEGLLLASGQDKSYALMMVQDMFFAGIDTVS